MKYLLGTGYAGHRAESTGDSFTSLWWHNMMHYADPKPDAICALCVNGSSPDYAGYYSPGGKIPYSEILLPGNLGHVHQLIGKEEPAKKNRFCGWSAGVIALAMLAYNNETDFIYLEQDCLAFGRWLEKLYSDLGSHKVAFGKLAHMPCAQSLFIVKHDYIPTFVALYMTSECECTLDNLPEHKFMRWLQKYPGQWKQHNMGVDRDRPLPITEFINMGTPFYAQKLTDDEILELEHAKIIQ